MPTHVHPLAISPLLFVSLSASRAPTPVINQPTSNGQALSCFVRLNKQPAPAYHHHDIAPPTVPSQTHALGLTIRAYDEWINDAGQTTHNWTSAYGQSKNRAFGASPTLARRRRAKGSPTLSGSSSVSQRWLIRRSRHLHPGGTGPYVYRQRTRWWRQGRRGRQPKAKGSLDYTRTTFVTCKQGGGR
ncbi:hypothetical protein BKA70DRAFT_241132 [Coprinopsis sp. MPI-PUGE-AT-0042]|nr:hypothetical protein BKA70DRAFT_241132 [Coprinopsis sp. MPI-PUGE-AT-0042]